MLVMGTQTAPASSVLLNDPTELVKPDVAVARVATCGFRDVRPEFDETLQESIIRVFDVGSASEKQLRCVALASLDTRYYVAFPASVDQIYQPLYWNMSAEREKVAARAWVEKRGLLPRLPTYDPKLSDEASFARSLERLCGSKATGALKPMHGMATIDQNALSTGKLGDDTLWCLLNVAVASGYSIGVIGNEAYQDPRPPN